MSKRAWKILTLCLTVMMTVTCLSACCVPSLMNVEVESILLSKTDVILTEGESITVTSTVLPENATEKTITWTSSDENVATVNSSGKITAVSAGECEVTAKAGGKTATLQVVVEKSGPDFKALYEDIDSDVKYGWSVGSDGSYLSADSNVYDLDDYSNSAIVYSIRDMNKNLGLPDALYNDMITTTWSMGKQQETYENVGIKVTWTYHPDKGLEVTYKLLNM